MIISKSHLFPWKKKSWKVKKNYVLRNQIFQQSKGSYLRIPIIKPHENSLSQVSLFSSSQAWFNFPVWISCGYSQCNLRWFTKMEKQKTQLWLYLNQGTSPIQKSYEKPNSSCKYLWSNCIDFLKQFWISEFLSNYSISKKN